ncbi:hypothetical protein L3i20_v225840 [Paenibacillus sp. L3-i20]|nr:hypothetical protein L3i20_v225840 [Paenibacillus sp. L3-i20]
MKAKIVIGELLILCFIGFSSFMLNKSKTLEYAFQNAKIDVKNTIEFHNNGKSLVLFQRTFNSNYGFGIPCPINLALFHHIITSFSYLGSIKT